MTHLGVHQQRIVHASSFTIANDNDGGNQFWYDRHHPSLLTVPDGWAFIVTDVMVEPSPVSGEGIQDSDRFILAVISFDNQGYRTFLARFTGDSNQHYPFSGGYVIPGGHTPTFRNTTLSTCHAEASLLGYFVEGSALNPGQAAVPEDPALSLPATQKLGVAEAMWMRGE